MAIVNKSIKDFKILAALKGSCPECAVEHDPSQPHNLHSLFYQFKFYQVHGCWPTSKDAMAHCLPDIQQIWSEELSKYGVDI